MSQVQKELTEITNTLNNFPQVLKKSRIDVAEKAAIATEITNGAANMSGLQTDYYSLIQQYATERALIIENSTSRLNFYDINDPSAWSGLSTTFTFPTATQFIFYVFDEQGNPLTWDPAYYIIESEPGVIAKQSSFAAFFEDPINYSIPDYTVDTVTAGGVNHTRITFTNALNETPEIGARFGLLNGNDELFGYMEVGIEGLELNTTWDALQTVDLSNDTAIENWFSDMMVMSNNDFGGLSGDYLSGAIPEDDVIKSADPTITSSSSKPYTNAKLERSPFFPSLNDVESDWPSDMDAIDVNNRKFVQDGTPLWAVYPKFRWEGKLEPSLGAGVYDEQAPNPYTSIKEMNDFTGIAINATDFPENHVDAMTDTTYEYFWDQATDKIMERVIDNTGTNPTTESFYPCTYNSMSDKITEWESGFGPIFNAVLAQVSGFTNAVDSAQATNDQTFLTYLQSIESDYSPFETYHNGRFTVDGDTTAFDTKPATYDQSPYNTLSATLSSSMFTDRVTELEGVIGDAQSRTGYVGEVIKAADLLVNKNFGAARVLLNTFSGLDDLKTSLVKLRKKYNAYA